MQEKNNAQLNMPPGEAMELGQELASHLYNNAESIGKAVKKMLNSPTPELRAFAERLHDKLSRSIGLQPYGEDVAKDVKTALTHDSVSCEAFLKTCVTFIVDARSRSPKKSKR